MSRLKNDLIEGLRLQYERVIPWYEPDPDFSDYPDVLLALGNDLHSIDGVGWNELAMSGHLGAPMVMHSKTSSADVDRFTQLFDRVSRHSTLVKDLADDDPYTDQRIVDYMGVRFFVSAAEGGQSYPQLAWRSKDQPLVDQIFYHPADD